jgi:hypothetical protein
VQFCAVVAHMSCKSHCVSCVWVATSTGSCRRSLVAVGRGAMSTCTCTSNVAILCCECQWAHMCGWTSGLGCLDVLWVALATNAVWFCCVCWHKARASVEDTMPLSMRPCVQCGCGDYAPVRGCICSFRPCTYGSCHWSARTK